MQLDLRIEELGERHIEPHLRLSRSEYGESAPVSTASHLRWKFLENPQGPSIGVHLYCGTELVGRAIALNRTFLHAGKFYRAAHVVDLLVRSDFRGMAGLHLLMKGLKQLEGFDLFLIMSPNPAGAAVWEKLWKMKACFELDASAIPLRPFSLLHSLKKLPNLAAVSAFDAPLKMCLRAGCLLSHALRTMEIEGAWPDASELDELFLEGCKDRTVGNRTSRYLQWRYQNSPIFRYEPLFIRIAGKLTGFLIVRRTTFEGMDCTFIVDAFGSPSHPGIIRTASRVAIRKALKEDSQIVLFIGNSAFKPLAELTQLPFIRIPSRRLPRRLTVFAEWISKPEFPITRNQLYLGLGDSDVV